MTLSTPDYRAYKITAWNSQQYYELRMSHYEINVEFYDKMFSMLEKTKENYVDSVKLASTLLWSIFVSAFIPIALVVIYLTSKNLTKDTVIAIETFRILDTRIVLNNPYLKNRLKFFFSLSGLQK
jgi:hypothetical protein